MRKQFTILEQTIWDLVVNNEEGLTPNEIVYTIQILMAEA